MIFLKMLMGKLDWLIAAALLASLGGLMGVCYLKGRTDGTKLERTVWLEKQAQEDKAAKALQVKSDAASVKVVTKYVEKQAEVKVKKEIIKQEVIRYVQSKSKSCHLDAQWVLHHDRAAANTVSDTSRRNHETTSSAALPTITDNYGICHDTREQLLACQSWIKEQQGANKGE